MTAVGQPPVVRHRVVPFDTLTESERAEHMVACHGFDEDWFAAYAPIPDDRYPTRAEALAYWAAHPVNADDEHAAEHHAGGEFDGVGGGIPHIHDKAPR